MKKYIQHRDASHASNFDDRWSWLAAYPEEVRLSTARTGISERGISPYPVKYLLFREALEAL